MPTSHPLNQPDLQQLIDRQPLLVAPTTPVQTAISMMATAGASCVLVVEDHDQHSAPSLCGILTCHDWVRLSAQTMPFDQMPIAAVMTQPVITLTAADLSDIGVALALWRQHQIHHLPVVDEADQVIGVLTQAALTDWWAQSHLASVAPPVAVKPAAENPEDRSALRHELQATLEELTVAEEELRLQNDQLESERQKYWELFNFAPDGYLVTDSLGVIQAANQAIVEQLKLSSNFILGKSLIAFVDPPDYPLFYDHLNQLPLHRQKQTWETTLCPRQGQPFWAEVTVTPIDPHLHTVTGLRWLVRDISARKSVESLLATQNTLLERIAKAEPLSEILAMLLQSIELQLVDARCSIMLCDRDGRLHTIAAPHLSATYVQAIEGVAIGEGVGSCGTAAFRQAPVIVTDIATDPLWQDYRDLALGDGLKACWSVPIFASDRSLLGVFGVYHLVSRAPQPFELDHITEAANLAGIAIERDQATQTLRQLNQDLEHRVVDRTAALQASEERWQLALRGTNDGIWDWDLATHTVFYSSRWKQMRGFTDDAISDAPTEWFSRIHPEDYDRVVAAIDDHLTGHTAFLAVEYRTQQQQGHYLWVLDRGQALYNPAGQAIRLSGSTTDITQRQQAEQALRHYERMVNAVTDGMVLVDRNYRYQVANQAFLAQKGKTSEEILGHTVAEIMGQEPFERVLKANLDQALAGQIKRHEMWFTPFGQPVQYLSVTLSPYRDAEQAIVGAVIVGRNITALKQAEAAAQESERRYAALATAAPVAIFRLDAALSCVYVNDRWSAMTGRPAASALGNGWFETLHPDDREGLLAKWATMYAEASPDTQILDGGEGRHQRPDGSINWFHVQTVREIAADGTLVGYIGTLTDITEHKAAEMALRKSEHRYRALMAGASDAIFWADVQGNLLEANQKAALLLGYSHAELAQLHMSQIHPPEVLDAARYYFNQAIAHNLTAPLESLVLCKDGRRIPVDITGDLIEFEGEQIMQGIFRDRTERARLEAERQQVQNALYESQQFLQTVLDTFPLSVFWKDRDLVYLGANRNFLRDTGLTCVTDLIGKTDYELPWSATEAELYRADDQEVIQTNQAKLGIVEPQRLANGTQTWIETNKLPLHNRRGEVIGVLGTYQDISDRKQAELALAQEVLRRVTVFNASSDGIHILDRAGNLIEANQSFADMLGYTLAEVAHLQVADWDAQWSPAELRVIIQTDAFDNCTFETLHRRKDGSIFPVEISRRTLEWQGESSLVCISRDISARKQAELALQTSQRFIQQIADASPNILYLYDRQLQRNTYINRGITSILGYTPEAIQAMGAHLFSTLLHPDDLARLPAYHAQVDATPAGEVVQFEYRMRHANGEWRWLQSHDAVFQRDAQGQVTQTIGVAQDITPRKRLEQEQRRLIALLEASTDYILITDRMGQVIWHNAALKQLRGIAANVTAIPQQPTDYHPQGALEILEQQAVPTAIAHGSWLGETVLLDAAGQEIPVSQLLMAHKSPQGEVEFFSSIMRDMRVHKAYEQQLERSNAELLRATRLKDEFLANMSHELRTPLNAILGLTEGLQEQIFGPINERQHKALETIDRSGTHLLALINDILDVAKVEAGQMELEVAPTVISHLCQSSVAFIKQQAHQKRLQVEINLPATLPDVWMDERRIRQVLINLLNNAVKFTPEGGCITLAVSLLTSAPGLGGDASPHLRIAVTDTGIGIAPAHIPRLFQPFVQIDSALNRQYNGTGLGLALVKRIVELHGGQVGLTSELGGGSCFTIDLPLQSPVGDPRELTAIELMTTTPAAPPTDQAPGSIDPSRHPAPLILLVEDNDANVSTLSSYLKAKGYQILLATEGQTAIAIAQTHHPDLILMDIQMPGMDGLEAIQQIRRDPNLGDIPIIALTALAMTGDRDRCLAAGATAYLAKPVKLRQLVVTLQSILKTQEISE